MNADIYPNTITPPPKHSESGEYRIFTGKWEYDDGLPSYTGDREGCDIYCAECDNWNTVKDTPIWFGIAGKCKNCGTDWNKTQP